jgi:fatty-acyl-CoA synthase
VAYVVPADPGRFAEAELLAWARTTIGEPAARPKRIYPIETIPVTAIGKHYKPALAADAAARAATDVLAKAGLPGAHVTAAHENGRLVITVTGADPQRVREALAGFPLTIRVP